MSETAPTMGKLQKVRYTHTDMIDFLIANPGVSQGVLAARYGYSEGWLSNVMASDAFKTALAARREQLVDPTLVQTIEERFRGLTLQSLDRLQQKLAAPNCSDNVVLKAVELGAKALAIGGNAPPPPPAGDHLAKLAERLVALQSNVQRGVVLQVPVEDAEYARS